MRLAHARALLDIWRAASKVGGAMPRSRDVCQQLPMRSHEGQHASAQTIEARKTRK